MNVFRFPSIQKVQRGFAYGGKTYVNMAYVVKSMSPKEREQVAYWEQRRGRTVRSMIADAAALLDRHVAMQGA